MAVCSKQATVGFAVLLPILPVLATMETGLIKHALAVTVALQYTSVVICYKITLASWRLPIILMEALCMLYNGTQFWFLSKNLDSGLDNYYLVRTPVYILELLILALSIPSEAMRGGRRVKESLRHPLISVHRQLRGALNFFIRQRGNT